MIGLVAAALLAAAPESPGIEPPTPPPAPFRSDEQRVPLRPPEREEPHASIGDGLGEQSGPESPGSQFGVVGILAATVDVAIRTTRPDPLGPSRTQPSPVGFNGTAGIGVRWGFFARTMERQWMPAVDLVVGSGFGPDGFAPFLEARLEYLTVTGGGPLQPNFTVYGAGGMTSSRFGIYGAPNGVRPHAGLGLGWNWLPKSTGASGHDYGYLAGGWGGGNPAALVLVAGIAAMVFAGRVELQYTAAPIDAPGTDFVSVVFGVGG